MIPGADAVEAGRSYQAVVEFDRWPSQIKKGADEHFYRRVPVKKITRLRVYTSIGAFDRRTGRYVSRSYHLMHERRLFSVEEVARAV